MYRVPLYLVLALCVVSQSFASSTISKRDLLGLLGIESENGDNSIASGLDDIGSIILTIKGQIKEIFEDIFLQCLKHIIDYLCNLKIRLLKKIGQYTLSHVFHAIFDGVSDFVVEEENVAKTETTTTESSYLYRFPYATAQFKRQAL